MTAERFVDGLTWLFIWPLDWAHGKAWPIRLVVLTVGWLYMVPVCVVVNIPLVLIGLPWMLWEDVRG